MIPDFDDERGILPEGIHEAGSWQDVVDAFEGSPRRRELVCGLKAMLIVLGTALCQRVYLDGSFVTDKETPGDFDLAFDLEGMDLDKLPLDLQRFDPDSRQRQKALYGGEALPNVTCTDTGELFVDFFQNDKVHGGRKGIVAIDPRIVPNDD